MDLSRTSRKDGKRLESTSKSTDSAAMFSRSAGTTFGGTSSGGLFSSSTTTTTATNPNKDFEVSSPPEDSVSCLQFSPDTIPSTFLAGGSWNNSVRCWEVSATGQTAPKAEQMHQAPVLDLAWSDDGTKIFTASCDKSAKMWDLQSNQFVQVAQHDAPVKFIGCIKAPNYQCIVTGSWDKTIKFWDLKSPSPMATLQLPEKLYCMDVKYPLAVAGTANRKLVLYQLEGTPREYKTVEPQLKFQLRCVSIFNDKKTNTPHGFALGSIEGRVAINVVNPINTKDNFTFKCHRSTPAPATTTQDIYAVNDLAFHPVHNTLATVGSDGRFNFWDKDARTKLKTSEMLDQPITTCCFDAKGNIFAYAGSYDWSKGHEYYDPSKSKPRIFLRACADEMKPQKKT